MIAAYCIDSQKFDLNFHGHEVLKILRELLASDPYEDIIITTGTDTIKWLSNLVAISEKKLGSTGRRVTIASSMMNKDAPGGQDHIDEILNATNSLLKSSREEVPPGVYVTSAQEELVEKVIFYGLNAPDDRITKFSSSSIGAVYGTNPAFTVFKHSVESEVGVKYEVRPRFRSEEDKKGEAARNEALATKEREIEVFCDGAKMTLFPTLAQSEPSLIAKYYEDLKAGDLSICEIDQGWISGKKAKEYREMVKKLSLRGVKVLLCNRKYHYATEEEVSERDIQILEQVLTRVDGNKNVKIYNSLPTTSLYTKLAFRHWSGEMGGGASASAGGAAGSPSGDDSSMAMGGGGASGDARSYSPPILPGALVKRYIPDFKSPESIFRKTYRKLFDFCHNAILLEALACAVIPKDLLDIMHEITSEVHAERGDAETPFYIFLTSPYKEGDSKIKYDASAEDKDLEKLFIYRMGKETAREFMREWNTEEGKVVADFLLRTRSLSRPGELTPLLMMENVTRDIAKIAVQENFKNNKTVSCILESIFSQFREAMSVTTASASPTPSGAIAILVDGSVNGQVPHHS